MSNVDDEFRVTIKVRNNLLLRAIEKSYKTIRLTAEASGVSLVEIYKLVNMQRSPLNEQKQWRDTVIRLCDALGVLPDEVFAESQYEALATNRAEFTAGMQDIIRLMDVKTPDQLLEEKEHSQALDAALETLTSRERQVLRMRIYEDMTLEECANRFDVHRERIRQIEARALRKMRHPDRAKLLRAA